MSAASRILIKSFNGSMCVGLVVMENLVEDSTRHARLALIETNVLNAFGRWQHEVRSRSVTGQRSHFHGTTNIINSLTRCQHEARSFTTVCWFCHTNFEMPGLFEHRSTVIVECKLQQKSDITRIRKVVLVNVWTARCNRLPADKSDFISLIAFKKSRVYAS